MSCLTMMGSPFTLIGVDYTDMLGTARRGVSGDDPGEAATWLALCALVQTAQLAGRDLGPATFDWARYAVAIYDAWDTVTAVMAPREEPASIGGGVVPTEQDSLSLRWAVMRLSCAVAATFAAAAAGEPDAARRTAFTRAAARLTEAAACLRPEIWPRHGGGTAVRSRTPSTNSCEGLH